MAVQHVVCRMYTPPCRGTVHYFLCRLSLFVPGSLPCALCLLSYFFSPGDRSRSSFIHRDIPFSFLFAFWSCLPLVPSFLRLRCQGARQTRRSLPSHLLSGSIPNHKDSLQVPPFSFTPRGPVEFSTQAGSESNQTQNSSGVSADSRPRNGRGRIEKRREERGFLLATTTSRL
ncbi:hypothetical protein J3E69DRAFT_121506 [Trichoderma sp. SZMC 28015]